MSDIVLQRDVGSLGVLKRLGAAASAVAAGTGDSTTTTGTTIDRFAFASSGLPKALAAGVLYDATLQSGKTLSIGYAVQHSDDGSTWADYQTATYAVVATGASGGSTAAGELEIGVFLGSAKRYVRLNSAVDLSATGTDTAVTRAVGFFAGFDRLPS